MLFSRAGPRTPARRTRRSPCGPTRIGPSTTGRGRIEVLLRPRSPMPGTRELRIVRAVRPQGRNEMSRKIAAIASCLVLAAAFSVAMAQGTLEVIHSFGEGDGEYPSTELVMDGPGNL